MDPKALKFKEDGNVKFKNGQYQQAIQDYTSAINAEPKAKEAAPLYGNRSAAWFMLKAYKQCSDDCFSALNIDSSLVKIRQRLTKSLLAQGEFTSAKQNINKILEITPDDAEAKKDKDLAASLEVKLNDANAALASGNFQQAVNLYRILQQHASGCDDLVLKEIQANIGLHNYATVIRDCLQLIRADKGNVEAYYYRAKGLYYLENYDQAVSHLQECLRLTPDHSAAAKDIKKVRLLTRLMKAAESAVFVRDFEEAVKNYTEALEIDKDNKRLNAKLFSSRADAKYKLKQFEEALEDCQSAVKLQGDVAEPYITCANIFIALEKYEDAINTLEQTLKEVDPNNLLAAQRLSEAQFQLRKSKRTNYYELLGVMSVASLMEIREAYKNRAMEWHPDKHSSKSPEEKSHAEHMFKTIQEGYEILMDAFKRDLYDKGYDIEAINEKVQMKQAHEKRQKTGH
eukprot:TRINITY_DN4942_c0_g1_i2.p1 TRINITY_DN4942_c0_g1~~TRINITY_DN4942_c0_g1_i2.p1  ORF type:complete len:457 (+),score=124.89 TRINITY_DN4942_c0_g1_i2:93-1463(+)